MKTLWSDEDRRILDERMARLTPAHTPLWGRMTAPQMVAHLVDALRMAIGELHVPMRKTVFRYPPLKQLLVYVVPMPKNVPTAKQLQREPGAWESELAALRGMLPRFAARDRNGAWPVHPIFGPLGARGWGALALRHCDHHLRQFGV
jgi:hypothetical protein